MGDKCTLSKEDMIFNLNKSLDEERRALVTCEELINNLKDESDKEKISDIIKDEKKHIEIVEYLIKLTETYYIE